MRRSAPSASIPHVVSTSRAARFATSFFGNPLNAAISLVLFFALAKLGIWLFQWAVIDAAFFPAIPKTCRNAEGACWSFVIAKHSQILFGIYPASERWRPAIVCLGLVSLLVYSMRTTSWNSRLALFWTVALVSVFVLMGGNAFGLEPVPTSSWGGLPVTLILTVVAIGAAFPLAIALALARRSDMPFVRISSTLMIEGIRAMPLLSILFIASIMLPILVPQSLLPDKFVRALLALWIFAAAYLAEVIRGGLQAIPLGQHEAGRALGLTWWQTQRLIVLPQTIILVIPALTNTVIVMIKNTALVLVVGLFDLISSGKAALADPEWSSPSAETYLFIAVIYFSLCFSFSRFADRLERSRRQH